MLHADPERALPDRGALQGRRDRHASRPTTAPSAVHADRWMPVKPGGDAALALGMAHVLVEEKPLRPRLRARADRPAAAGARGHAPLPARARPARRAATRGRCISTIRSAASCPAPREQPRARRARARRSRAASRRRSRDGTKVSVRPVFELLRERLASYTPGRRAPSSAARRAPQIRGLARRIGEAPRPRRMVTTSNFAQVLPRQPDRARAGAGVRADRELRQEGQRLRRLPVPGARRPRGLRCSRCSTCRCAC